MRNLLYISCYTDDEPYKTHKIKWIESYGRFEWKVYIIKKQESWYRTTQEKPRVIMRALLEFPEHDIVFTDIDSTMHEEPTLFSDSIFRSCDISLMGDKIKNRFFSGTVYVSNNEKARDLINRWCMACDLSKHKHNRADDEIFCDLDLTDINWVNLDPRYTALTPMIDNMSTTIRHHRASNSSRNEIRGLRNVRLALDGTYRLIREDKVARQHLDNLYERIDDVTWRPWKRNFLDHIKVLPSIWNIVGKGPSLDNIIDVSGPTIAINDAGKILESKNLGSPLYVACQDLSGLRDYEPQVPMFLSPKAYSRFANNPLAFTYSYEGSETPNTITAVIAIRIATQLGAVGFRMYGFDGRKGEYSYATSLGYDSGPQSFRFKDHHEYIKKCTSLPLYWEN